MDQNLLEYNLPINAYATFDAVSLKELIKERLTQNSLFTDQNFEGSNLAALADIFAFAYHILLFYYNQTASEAMFDQAELYENMNKIVKSIGYKPSGPRTSVLNFEAVGTENLPVGAYTIKRYSTINVNGSPFSFNEDVSFDKTISGREQLTTLSENALLYQGSYFEYPDYTAIGEDYEVITVVLESVDQNVFTDFIDNDNIDVYVYDSTSLQWSQWREVDTLYLSKPADRVYEKRLNENGRYEIKFGNNISGKRLNAGDLVSIFYLLSNGTTIDIGTLQQGSSVTTYNSTRFRELNSMLYGTSLNSFITTVNNSNILFSNKNKSTSIADYEDVNSIRENAPKIFGAQGRAVTLSDYKSLILNQFSNILQSVEVISNDRYISEYIKYYYDIGLKSPNQDNNVLTSHFLFADSCDFNNVYIFAAPRNGPILNETEPTFLAASQKQIIKRYLDDKKMVSNEVVVIDPIYIAFDIGIDAVKETSRTVEQIREGAVLNIKIDSTSRIAKSRVRDLVFGIFKNYFDASNNSLGREINISDICRDILSIETVMDISTGYTFNNISYEIPGVSLVYWNPFYPQDDLKITNQVIRLPFFKFPFLYESSKFINKINVIS